MSVVECGFPAVAPQYDPADTLAQIGPTLRVDVSHPPGADGLLVPGTPSAAQVPALLDTGAGDSCIDEQLAIELGLPLVDRRKSAGVGGPDEFNVYLAHLSVPALGTSRYGAFLGVRLAAGGQQHKALIGRDLLRSAILVYDGLTGSVRLAR